MTAKILGEKDNIIKEFKVDNTSAKIMLRFFEIME